MAARRGGEAAEGPEYGGHGAGDPPGGEGDGAGARDPASPTAAARAEVPGPARDAVVGALGQAVDDLQEAVGDLRQAAGDPEALRIAHEELRRELRDAERQRELDKTRESLAAIAGESVSAGDSEDSE